jgi:hypothetical protein
LAQTPPSPVKGVLAQELGRAVAGRAIMRRLAHISGMPRLPRCPFDPIF